MQPSLAHRSPIETRLAVLAQRVDLRLENLLPRSDEEPRKLHQAMRYALLNGGKRMRPLFTYAVGEAMAVVPMQLDPLACAVELMHAYSLVHDDLPAMDDDDFRRGQPTCHRTYGEAIAMLAGDALQTLAFEILAQATDISTAVRTRLVICLAQACGSRGMAGGQAIDLEAVGKALTVDELRHMHALKTGALISCSVVMPALLAEANDTEVQALENYGRCVGLAFQIHDDVLDIEGDSAQLGKTQGADIARNKPTFPACLGLDASKVLAHRLIEQAQEQLNAIEVPCELLRHLATMTIERAR